MKSGISSGATLNGMTFASATSLMNSTEGFDWFFFGPLISGPNILSLDITSEFPSSFNRQEATEAGGPSAIIIEALSRNS